MADMEVECSSVKTVHAVAGTNRFKVTLLDVDHDNVIEFLRDAGYTVEGDD